MSQHSSNRNEQRQARALQHEQGISYTEALDQVRAAAELSTSADPGQAIKAWAGEALTGICGPLSPDAKVGVRAVSFVEGSPARWTIRQPPSGLSGSTLRSSSHLGTTSLRRRLATFLGACGRQRPPIERSVVVCGTPGSRLTQTTLRIINECIPIWPKTDGGSSSRWFSQTGEITAAMLLEPLTANQQLAGRGAHGLGRPYLTRWQVTTDSASVLPMGFHPQRSDGKECPFIFARLAEVITSGVRHRPRESNVPTVYKPPTSACRPLLGEC